MTLIAGRSVTATWPNRLLPKPSGSSFRVCLSTRGLWPEKLQQPAPFFSPALHPRGPPSAWGSSSGAGRRSASH